jgi:hypothetical protein
MPEDLPGGRARAARFRGARIENFVAQRFALAEVEDALFRVGQRCGYE